MLLPVGRHFAVQYQGKTTACFWYKFHILGLRQNDQHFADHIKCELGSNKTNLVHGLKCTPLPKTPSLPASLPASLPPSLPPSLYQSINQSVNQQLLFPLFQTHRVDSTYLHDKHDGNSPVINNTVSNLISTDISLWVTSWVMLWLDADQATNYHLNE